MPKASLKGSHLSLQQARLWSLQGDPQMYRVQCSILLKGPFQSLLFRQALQQIVEQHEILRTVFHRLPEVDTPVQVVVEEAIYIYEEQVLEEFNSSQQQEALAQISAAEQAAPFDLLHGPLLRVRLLRLQSQEHILLITLPALCADVATLRILVTLLSQTYAALLQQQEMSEDPLQYADAAAWQQDLLQEKDAHESIVFWQRELLRLADLPVPFVAHGHLDWEAASKAYLPGQFALSLDTELNARLFDMAQRYQVSCREILLTCWQILLSRFCGNTQITLGYLCNGRYYDDLSQALGAYSRIVPFPGTFLAGKTFPQLLRQVQANLEALLENQYYFSWSLTGDQQATKFLPLSFAYEEWPRQWKVETLSWQLLWQKSHLDRSGLHLSVDQIGQQLQLYLSYDGSLFSQEQVARLARGLFCMLRAVVGQPEQQVASLPVLEEEEQKALLNSFSGRPSSGHLAVLDRFESYAADHPEQQALRSGKVQWSYGELNRRANQLAHWLQKAGVKCDVPVGLHLERGPEMLIGILGVLKAGGAYVPLDVAWPVERLSRVLAEINAPVVLTGRTQSETLPRGSGLVRSLDECSWLEGEEETNLEKKDYQAGLAYILYTSGSTGTPKGVAVSRESLDYYVAGIRDRLGVEEGWHYATVSTLAADLGNTMIYGALSSGGCLHILPYEIATQGASLAEYMQSSKIDVLKIVPSHLWAMVQDLEKSVELLPRRHLMLGGEALTEELLEQLVRLASSCQLWNHYGPTETTVGVLLQNLGVLREIDLQKVPITLGYPIGLNKVYIMDEQRQVVPVGVTGELCIGGVGLARGYIKRAGQTAEKFIPDPYGETKGERIYLTGDLARYGEEGGIEFIGRKDRQIKLRGYRVELGEIEAVLREHRQVKDALVVKRGERLVGYVIARQLLENIKELRAWLSERLPEYMVPAGLVGLRSWPLTDNGKIDIQGLPNEEEGKARVIVVARTPVEELLVQIWRDVLGIQAVGIYDNFAELGGHSLLATQVISRIRAGVQIEIPLRAIFETPTIAGLAQFIEKTLRQGTGVVFPPFVRIARDQDIPLSFAQQRLWIIDQMTPGGSAYNIPVAARMRGSLRKDVLERSLREVVQRHEILRTTFVMCDEQPVQRIHDSEQVFSLHTIDLRELPLSEREERIRYWMQRESDQAFDLFSGPLFRARLLLLDEDDALLLWTMHHIVSDGWSSGILLGEVSSLYNAFVQNRPSPLSPLPIQYADYALWQRQWLQGSVLQRQEEYWRQQLAGSAPLNLFTDHPRPPEQTTHGATQVLRLPEELSQRLQELSQQEGVTLFMLLLAAFQVLLARYSGQEDITVGTPIANRTREEIEGVIGFFVNTLVLRTDLSGSPTFREVVRRVREISLGAYAHQDLPFEYLVERLQPERDPSRHPFFQVLFDFQYRLAMPDPLTGLQVESLPFEQQSAKFDLSLMARESDRGIICSLEYNTDLFEQGTIERLLANWQTLLEGIVLHPEQLVSDLPLLSNIERNKMLTAWNATGTEFPALCVHQLFEAQVASTPDALALTCGQQQLTYRDLDQQANQLAHYLRTLGVGPEVLVGIYVERSPEMLVGLLGILKAGGAYVPLDPLYPKERLAFMIADARLSVLLTQQRLLAELPEHQAHVVCLDADRALMAGQSKTSPAVALQAKNLAYVIYTSGSTGKPKGVQVVHDALANFLQTMCQQPGISAQDRLLAVTTLSFDIAGLELYLPLLVGAQVQLVSREVATDGVQLAEQIQSTSATIMQATPATWRLLLEAGWTGSSGLKILCGGEALPRQLARQLLEQTAALWNMYGPTETTIWSTLHEVAATDEVISIGAPIAHTQVYVLDRHLHQVPIGVTGELYIGGAGLARGYLNRADLTAERFISDPFSGEPGARLYHTGDLARYLASGELECLGRSDNQMKIRGFRIEPGEIEAILSQHPAIKDGVVIPRGENLRAYLVTREGEGAVSREELRGYLLGKLPRYMVPAQLVFLAALPLTANGKIDRRALEQREEEEEEEKWEEPRGVVEEAVEEIWEGLLGRKRIGRRDSFFALGGHSLLATQVIARIKRILGVEVPLRKLFERATIAGLGEEIEQALRRTASEEAPLPLRPASREQELPLSFAQQRLWFLAQLDPQSPAYNLPYALRLRGPLDQEVLEACFLDLVTRHEALRTTFELWEGQPVQRIHAPRGSIVQHQDLSRWEPEQRAAAVQRLVDQEVGMAFDLEQGPLLRVLLLHLEEQEHVLLLTLHHIVSDGWSSQVLVEEFSQIYAARVRGESAVLPELVVQYADYALWQREWLQGERLQRQERYWEQQLEGITPLEMPTDHLRLPEQSTRGALLVRELPGELGRQVRELARQEGVTLFMLLLAAFQVLLARYSGQEDIVVGTPIANRTQEEIEGVIGFFTNTLVLRTDLSGSPTFREVVRRVREVSLGAYAHQDLPFEYLVERLQPERDPSRHPLFQVVFRVEPEQREPEKLPGLEVEGLEQEEQQINFDLILIVHYGENGMHSVLKYNADLFEAATIERLLEHWHRLLENIVQKPDTAIGRLQLLDEKEWEQQVWAWNQTEQYIPESVGILQLIEQQVALRPEEVAVSADGQELSYGELNRRANRLARRLRKLGVGPEQVVGIYAERSHILIVGLLATLKAGGAYLPLEPGQPRERLTYELQDARAVAILAQPELREQATSFGIPIVCLDEWQEESEEGNLESTVQVENLAYVIYTSGSTGLPKGVGVTHLSLLNLVCWHQKAFELTSADRVSHLAGLGFDASVWELWPYLASGSSLCLVDDQTRLSPELLHAWLLREKITVSFLPTPLAEKMLVLNWPAATSLRLLLTGGDRLHQIPVSTLPFSVINNYGPTEYTVVGTSGRVFDVEQTEALPPIGRPIANTRVYLLDTNFQPVPIGAAGELYLGGLGVARGYSGQAGLTAEKFLPDPFSALAGARIYRTGDLARYRADGSLEYVGRRDQQVKIRGYRIELGEIEAILGMHPGVRECIVHVEEEQLIAYIVVKQAGQEMRAGAWRAYLEEKLPAYMVPGRFVHLPSLPLTPNGKVDRGALVELEEGGEEETKEQPQGAMEEAIAEIWAAVLEQKRAGRHESFFESGGHSLLAMQVMTRISGLFGVEVSLRKLFEEPTIAGLARRLREALAGEGREERPGLAPVEREQDMPISFAQQRLWLLDKVDSASNAYNIPLAVQLTGTLDREALEYALQEIVSRHEVLRTTFGLDKHQNPVQIIHAEQQFSLPMEELFHLSEDERTAAATRLATEEALRPFYLNQGPLFRAKLLQLDQHEYILLLTMHHIVFDGWSMHILTREMVAIYKARIQGKKNPLEPLPLQYADFAWWQRQFVQSQAFPPHFEYWKQQLQGARAFDLPTDRLRSEQRTYQTESSTFLIPSDIIQELKQYSLKHNATLFMVLLAAFQVLLYRITGTLDIVVGTDIANRMYEETEGLIGFFVNLLALRTQLDGQSLFYEVLRQVREIVLSAYAHQDVPFDLLVERLHIERRQGMTPLVSTLFVLQNMPGGATEEDLPGLTPTTFQAPVNLDSKFDLALFVSEGNRGLNGTINYSSELFDASTIAGLTRQYELLLRNVLEYPETPIHALELMTAEEKEYRKQQLEERRLSLGHRIKRSKGERVDLSNFEQQ
jgi:amino acid adenylation domain-containing protein